MRIESQFLESPFFGLLQQIIQVLLILVFFACLGSFFPTNYYSGLSIICTQVYQMVAAFVAWWFGQFLYIVQRAPHPELEPTGEFRPCHAFTASRCRPVSTLSSAPGHISFIYSLCINYLLCNEFFLLLLSLICTIFCAQKNDPAGLYPLASPRLDGGLCQNFITPCRGLRHHSADLHCPCYITTSECRALCSAT